MFFFYNFFILGFNVTFIILKTNNTIHNWQKNCNIVVIIDVSHGANFNKGLNGELFLSRKLFFNEILLLCKEILGYVYQLLLNL